MSHYQQSGLLSWTASCRLYPFPPSLCRNSFESDFSMESSYPPIRPTKPSRRPRRRSLKTPTPASSAQRSRVLRRSPGDEYGYPNDRVRHSASRSMPVAPVLRVHVLNAHEARAAETEDSSVLRNLQEVPRRGLAGGEPSLRGSPKLGNKAGVVLATTFVLGETSCLCFIVCAGPSALMSLVCCSSGLSWGCRLAIP
jgi:hypothetical protein